MDTENMISEAVVDAAMGRRSLAAHKLLCVCSALSLKNNAEKVIQLAGQAESLLDELEEGDIAFPIDPDRWAHLSLYAKRCSREADFAGDLPALISAAFLMAALDIASPMGARKERTLEFLAQYREYASLFLVNMQ